MRPRRNPNYGDLDPTSSRTGVGFGAALSAGAAAVISAGLVYWIGSAGDPTLKHVSHVSQAPVYAPSEPDAGEVARAYDQAKEIYAGRGAAGVADFARGCAQSLASDPRTLDFCVAFDIFASSLVGDDAMARAWRANADERDLAMARVALAPGDDPLVRLAQIRQLARRTSLAAPDLAAPRRGGASGAHRVNARHVSHAAKPSAKAAVQSAPVPPPSPIAQPATQPAALAAAQPADLPAIQPPGVAPAAAPESKPRARPAAVKKASVRKPSANRTAAHKAAVRKVSAGPVQANSAAGSCRSKATAGERTVCASPALRKADAQLQAAYRKAVAAGVDQGELAREQTRFRGAVNAAAPDRVAVERLYYQRTRVLEGLSESP